MLCNFQNTNPKSVFYNGGQALKNAKTSTQGTNETIFTLFYKHNAGTHVKGLCQIIIPWYFQNKCPKRNGRTIRQDNLGNALVMVLVKNTGEFVKYISRDNVLPWYVSV